MPKPASLADISFVAYLKAKSVFATSSAKRRDRIPSQQQHFLIPDSELTGESIIVHNGMLNHVLLEVQTSFLINIVTAV